MTRRFLLRMLKASFTQQFVTEKKKYKRNHTNTASDRLITLKFLQFIQTITLPNRSLVLAIYDNTALSIRCSWYMYHIATSRLMLPKTKLGPINTNLNQRSFFGLI